MAYGKENEVQAVALILGGGSAYDYDACHCIRVNGAEDIKVAMYKEVKRQGVEIYDRVMPTSLLLEGGVS